MIQQYDFGLKIILGRLNKPDQLSAYVNMPQESANIRQYLYVTSARHHAKHTRKCRPTARINTKTSMSQSQERISRNNTVPAECAKCHWLNSNVLNNSICAKYHNPTILAYTTHNNEQKISCPEANDYYYAPEELYEARRYKLLKLIT